MFTRQSLPGLTDREVEFLNAELNYRLDLAMEKRDVTTSYGQMIADSVLQDWKTGKCTGRWYTKYTGKAFRDSDSRWKVNYFEYIFPVEHLGEFHPVLCRGRDENKNIEFLLTADKQAVIVCIL